MMILWMHMIFCCGSVSSLSCQHVDDNGENAAVIYREESETLATVPNAVWAKLEQWLGNPIASPDPAVEHWLRVLQPSISRLGQAAAMRECRFETEDNGPMSGGNPHAMVLDRGYKLLLADAQIGLRKGRPSDAMKGVASVMSLAAQTGSENVPTDSGQAMWMMRKGDALLQHAVDIGAVGPEDASVLLHGMSRLESHDPTGIGSSGPGFGAKTLEWTKKQLEEGQLEQLQTYIGITGGDRDVALESLPLDDAMDALDKTKIILDDFANVLSSDQTIEEKKQALDALQQVVADDALIGTLAPWLKYQPQLWVSQMEEAETMLRERRTLLKGIASGEIDVNEYANAAYWYTRGAEMLMSVPCESWAAIIDEVSASAVDQSGERADRRWARVCDDAMRLIRRGSEIERCDFTLWRRRASGQADVLHASPAYVNGMWRAMQLIVNSHDDESRWLGSGEQPVLQCGIAMILHLKSDGLLISSMAAHHMLSTLYAYVLEHQKTSSAICNNDDLMNRLLQASMRYDPFEYTKAIANARKDAAGYLAFRYHANAKCECRSSDARRIISTLDDDHIVITMFLMDDRAEAIDDGAVDNDPDRSGICDEMIDVVMPDGDAVARMRRMAGLYQVLADACDCVVLEMIRPSAFVDFEVRRRMSRELWVDVREWIKPCLDQHERQ